MPPPEPGAAVVRVLVTRPAPQAGEWVAVLRAAGVDAVALPLIGIAPPADPHAVSQAWSTLAGRGLVVFVSPNAAERFFAARPAGLAWPPALPAAAPGPGTARVLAALGVARTLCPADDAAQFDSEALWAQLGGHDWRGVSVLVVRGDGGRDWLVERLRAAGARVEPLAAYRRVPPELDADARARLRAALDRPADHVWLFSSSEAIDHLAARPAVAPLLASATAIATHPRIAERARRAGFARVLDARATPAAVIACIQSIGP